MKTETKMRLAVATAVVVALGALIALATWRINAPPEVDATQEQACLDSEWGRLKLTQGAPTLEVRAKGPIIIERSVEHSDGATTYLTEYAEGYYSRVRRHIVVQDDDPEGLEHEILHAALDTLAGDPDSQHKSPLWAKNPINCQ